MASTQLETELVETTRTQDLPETAAPKVAFLSGHIDLPRETFIEHYAERLDTAIQAGHHFVLSNAGGADTLALDYLLEQNVAPSRITIYIHTPPVRQTNETMRRIDELRTGPATLERYRTQGFGVEIVHGWHTERDANMTANSDYDILWVRPKEETKMMYGAKYRAGRISGTQKNKDRRKGEVDF